MASTGAARAALRSALMMAGLIMALAVPLHAQTAPLIDFYRQISGIAPHYHVIDGMGDVAEIQNNIIQAISQA